MSSAVAERPQAVSKVVHIARCSEHGLHGQRTECYVCGGPVQQVAMVPVVDPERGPCGCGCGHPKRPNSDYAYDACRTRHWKRETGYVDPRRSSSANAANAPQARLLRPSRPGGRQISYGVAVRVLAAFLVEETPLTEPEATQVAERVLSRALPKRQRKPKARTRRTAPERRKEQSA